MRRSNRMKRIMCEQWVPFLPSYARTETMGSVPACRAERVLMEGLAPQAACSSCTPVHSPTMGTEMSPFANSASIPALAGILEER